MCVIFVSTLISGKKETNFEENIFVQVPLNYF